MKSGLKIIGLEFVYLLICAAAAAVFGALISLSGITLAMTLIIGITGLMKPESLSFITYYIWPELILLFTLIIGFKAKKQD